MQGFNMGRYVPPELEGVVSFNQASGKGHALGQRARKLKTQGILTVRFEMPYAVWCNHCPKPTIIGQGVRFNAEKKKVGNYLSTPIWSFRMKHAACGGVVEIHTDPKNTRYVVVEGGKQRDTGEDRIREGEDGMEILTAEEREKRREDAFAVLEDRVDEKKVEKDNKRRIQDLLEERERHWSDPYEASRMVRKGFRRERKVRVREAEQSEEIKERLGLGLDLLPAAEEDGRRAGLIEFGGSHADSNGLRAISKPLFNMERAGESRGGTKAQKKVVVDAERKRQLFEKQLRDNTRAARDPFALNRQTTSAKAHQPGIATKRVSSTVDTHQAQLVSDVKTKTSADKSQTTNTSLVAYDSD